MPYLAAAVFACALLVAQVTPASQPTGSPTPTVTPSAAATPTYRYVYLATPAPATTPFAGPGAPQIYEIDLTDRAIAVPGALAVRVLTNPEVVSVVARTLGQELPIPQHDRGTFVLGAHLTDIPDSLRNRTYDIDFIATVADGRNATVTLPVTLR